jgi:hypothetical protein
MAGSKEARLARNEARRRRNDAAREAAGATVKTTGAVQPDHAPDRDGLMWLVDKRRRRITQAQCREGLHYRDLFRVVEPGAAIKSSIESLGMGGGGGKGSPVALGGSFEDSQAKLELHVIREHLFGGQEDLKTVMDGVCGHGWTLRYLAGRNQMRAAELEQALRIALDLMVGNRALKEQARVVSKRAA